MRYLAKAYIGTSGFTYAHWGGGVFYPLNLPQTKWLEYYSGHFNSVEINASFYHLPKLAVFESWYERTPLNFVFAVKGSRFITHIKRLKDCQEPLARFWGSVKGLKEKLAVVLWQLPPGLLANVGLLANFCVLLKKDPLGKQVRQVFEFRDESWFTSEIYSLLRRYNLAISISHSNRFPYHEITTADFIYLRFHGGQILYATSYTDRELESWAQKCRKWLAQGKDVYVYFNNDVGGAAVKNAQSLIKLLAW